MLILLLILLVHGSSGVIFSLNLSEYSKMPELYQMDDFDPCLSDPGGLYCVLDAELHPGDNPGLMQTIREYSEYSLKHYNHTQIHRATCVTKTCKDFILNRDLENDADLKLVLEECVNASIWDTHKLNARVLDISMCRRYGEKRPFTTGDYVMAGIYLVIIILNVLGTIYDHLIGDTSGNPYLLAFSIRRNWKKLTAPRIATEHRLHRLKCFDGIRTLTVFAVYTSHTALVMAFSYLQNPLYIEMAYDDPKKMLLINGEMITYTFFVMSGFLVAFNIEMQAEKHKVTWMQWPKGVVLRWLRLTPLLALVIFTVMTLNRHVADGPQWQLAVTSESDACGRYWWAHLLYFNNYIYDDSHCLPQTWYLAADFQLFALGLIICLVCRRPRAQMITLTALMVVGLIIPAAHTYFQDLDGTVFQSPEFYRTIYKSYDTFRITYVTSHANLPPYIMGIIGGLLAFRWFKNEKTVSETFQKYRWLIWLLFPLGVANIFSGGLFYWDNHKPSMLVKLLYASLRKPLFQFGTLVFIWSSIFKGEGILRGIFEWRGFTWTARISYGAFLIHPLLQRGLIGAQRLPTYMSDYYMITVLSATTFLTTAVAAAVWLAVESPLATVTKLVVFKKLARNNEPIVIDTKILVVSKTQDAEVTVTTKV